MTQPIITILQQQQWLKDEGYFMTYPGVIPKDSYGNIILSKLPIIERNLSVIKLPSKLGRRLIVGTFLINNEEVMVGTSHLESYDENVAERKRQWRLIKYQLRKTQHAFFMGDCNFESDEERLENVKKTFCRFMVDLQRVGTWLHL